MSAEQARGAWKAGATPEAGGTSRGAVSADQARELLDSTPAKPPRRLGWSDHLSAAVVVLASLGSGMLALGGNPWWAIPAALVAVVTGMVWLKDRDAAANEPRLPGKTWVVFLFCAGLTNPIYRAIVHGETATFPESLILAGLAPAAWLVFYLVLVIRR